MGSFLSKILFTAILGALAAAGYLYLFLGDPIYGLREQVNGGAWAKYDAEILKAAEKNKIDPCLIKAVVWRESRFGADKVGTRDERGLMQITDAAAADYAKARGIKTLEREDLFKPEVNLDCGSWYLKRAMDHYTKHGDPIPFALAEYNAGRSRVSRWIGDTESKVPATAEEMKENSYDSTRAYAEGIERRYAFYKATWKIPKK